VLELLLRHQHVVKLALHGHVHANTRTLVRGIEFVTLASTTEYPMEWFELRLSECSASLHAHPLATTTSSSSLSHRSLFTTTSAR